MTLRPGVVQTIVAAALIGATGVALERTATEALIVVRPVVVVGVVLGVGFLLLGSARWIGIASPPMFVAVVLEAGFGDDPSWVRSILIGCLWFAALEMSWEAIDRRAGAAYTPAAVATRAREVGIVIAVTLALGFVAAASASFAPTRSVLLQASVLGALLTMFVVAVRTSAGRPSSTNRTGH